MGHPAKARRGEINRNDGGRGVYFEDPDGHLPEIITRPYGSGGWRLSAVSGAAWHPACSGLLIGAWR